MWTVFTSVPLSRSHRKEPVMDTNVTYRGRAIAPRIAGFVGAFIVLNG